MYVCVPNLGKLTRNLNVAIKMFSVWKPHEYYILCTLESRCERIFISFEIFSTHFENDLLNANLFSLFKNFHFLDNQTIPDIFIEKGKKQFISQVSVSVKDLSKDHLERSLENACLIWNEMLQIYRLCTPYPHTDTHTLARTPHTPQ